MKILSAISYIWSISFNSLEICKKKNCSCNFPWICILASLGDKTSKDGQEETEEEIDYEEEEEEKDDDIEGEEESDDWCLLWNLRLKRVPCKEIHLTVFFCK